MNYERDLVMVARDTFWGAFPFRFILLSPLTFFFAGAECKFDVFREGESLFLGEY